MLALVTGGVLLALHPTASYRAPTLFPLGNSPALTAQCFSPFNRLSNYQVPQFSGSQRVHQAMRAANAACSAATNGCEHIVDALGIGAVLLVGLSFLPRRRAQATERWSIGAEVI